MSAEHVRRLSDELARNPDSLAFVQLADELRRRGQRAEARSVALRGLERHPYCADAHDALARVHVDLGEDDRARDEWEMALHVDPGHLAALKGLAFLAFRQQDGDAAERYLRRAREVSPDDRELALALERISRTLAGESTGANGKGPHAAPSTSAPKQDAARRLAPNAAPNVAPASRRARELFAAVLGDDDRSALLLDRDGLVLAGAYIDQHGRDTGDEIAAELSGVSDEASRALTELGLGTWTALVAEAQHATVALAPAPDGALVLVAAARDTQVGLVRRLLSQARARAIAWLEATE